VVPLSSAASETALLREYLSDGKLMQVATVGRGGEPWLASVWYAADDQLRLVFASNLARVHSEDIRANPMVSGAVVAMSLEGLGQRVRGVTFSGRANQCSGPDVEEAFHTYATRWPRAAELFPVQSLIEETTPMRLYRIEPSRYVLFDEVNFPDQPRREISTW
jgi:uncharacterized protein YhbP (UPF0306 family)